MVPDIPMANAKRPLSRGMVGTIAKDLGVGRRVVSRVAHGWVVRWTAEAERVRVRLIELGLAPDCIRPEAVHERSKDESYWERRGSW